MKARFRSSTSLTQGFGLVEVMLSLVIGMLGMLVMYQVFANAETQKRTTISGNDAQGNAMAAMLTLEQDIRMAGYGFNAFPGFGGNNPVLGCNLMRYHAQSNPTQAFFPLLPVMIEDGGTGLADRITVLAGAPSALSAPVGFAPLAAGAGYSLNRAADQIGFNTGDLVLSFEQGKDCTLRQLTGKEGSDSEVLKHVFGEGAPFNNPGGIGVDYTSPGAQLLNLGNMEQVVFRLYTVESVSNATLSVRDLLRGMQDGESNLTEVADEIVNLQAQYGVDTGPGNSLVWVEPVNAWAAPLSSEQMQRVRAVRVAIVARSNRQERERNADGTCQITAEAPAAWRDPAEASGSAAAPVIDVSALTDWQCYRYRVLNTVIPLRNALWGET